MKDDAATTSPERSLAGALSDLSDLFRSVIPLHGRDAESTAPKTPPSADATSSEEVITRVHGLLRDAAARYESLQAEARAALGTDVSIPRLLQRLRPSSAQDPEGVASGPMAAMSRLFRAASSTILPVTTELAGRIDANAIAIYEPFMPLFHASSLRTTIGNLSGEWVRRPTDGRVGTPDIYLDLKYAYSIATPQVNVRLSWVGSNEVQVAGNGTAWTSTPMPPVDGRIIGHYFSGAPITPIHGLAKLLLEVRDTRGTSSHDVWIRTGPAAKPEEEEEGPILAPTPIPIPVPNPQPTGHPNDFLAALDPDQWRTLDDRIGDFVRTTLRDFEGVLERIDFSSERGLFREIGAALRGGGKG